MNEPATIFNVNYDNWIDDSTGYAYAPTATIAIAGASTVGSATYTNSTLSYNRIGNRIFFSGRLTWTAATGTGQMQITGFPKSQTGSGDETLILGDLRRRLHEPIVSQGKWLAAVLRGHYAYYGLPTNIEALDVRRTEVTLRWFKSLRRRSQRRRFNWTRMGRLAQQWLPRARIVHPWPQQRFAVRTRDKSPVR